MILLTGVAILATYAVFILTLANMLRIDRIEGEESRRFKQILIIHQLVLLSALCAAAFFCIQVESIIPELARALMLIASLWAIQYVNNSIKNTIDEKRRSQADHGYSSAVVTRTGPHPEDIV